MTAPHIIDPARLLGEALAEASPDLKRGLLQTLINALPSADADAIVGESHWVSFRLISQDGNDGQVHERDA